MCNSYASRATPSYWSCVWSCYIFCLLIIIFKIDSNVGHFQLGINRSDIIINPALKRSLRWNPERDRRKAFKWNTFPISIDSQLCLPVKNTLSTHQSKYWYRYWTSRKLKKIEARSSAIQWIPYMPDFQGDELEHDVEQLPSQLSGSVMTDIALLNYVQWHPIFTAVFAFSEFDELIKRDNFVVTDQWPLIIQPLIAKGYIGWYM